MGVIYRAKLYVHLQAEQEVKFVRKFLLRRESWTVEVVYLVDIALY